jgi:hypothetical protein
MENKKRVNLQLILPIFLLVVEIVVVIVLLVSGYKFTSYLPFFLILLGVFLANQIIRQGTIAWKVKKAVSEVSSGDSLVEEGKPMEAIKIWKNALMELPKDLYLSTLVKMEKIFEDQDMIAAVQQVRAIQAESNRFFTMTQEAKRATPKDRQQWQAKAYELRNMIKALPEEKGQDVEDATSKED